EQSARRIQTLTSVEGPSPRLLKTAVDAAADDLDHYARSLRAEVPAFVSAYTSAFGAMDGIIAVWIASSGPGRENLEEVRQKLAASIASIQGSRDPVTKFRDELGTVPGLTKRLKKAVRSTKAQLDELIAGIT